MTLFQRLIYKVLKPLNKKLSGIVNDIENNCTHIYLNGKSAMAKGEYIDTCEICKRSWQNDNSYDLVAKAYEGKYDEENY